MGIILCMRPGNKRRRYNVTLSLIGWAHTQYDPCVFLGDLLCLHNSCHMALWIVVIIGSNNGLSPIQCQSITCSNAELFSIEPWETKTSVKFEQNTIIFIQENHSKMSSAKYWPCCLGLSVRGSTVTQCNIIRLYRVDMKSFRTSENKGLCSI